MYIQVKNIAGYKKKILDCVDDNKRVEIDRLIDNLVLDVIECGCVNIGNYANIVSKTLGNTINEQINSHVIYMEVNYDK